MLVTHQDKASKCEGRQRQVATATDPYGFDAIGDLIRKGGYSQAVDLFRKAQEKSSRTDDPAFSGMLGSAYGMCLALEMFRAISDCHDHVIHQIKQHEIEMALQLQRMFQQAKDRVGTGGLLPTETRSGHGHLQRGAGSLKSACAPGGSSLKKLLHSLLVRNVPNRMEEDEVAGACESSGKPALFAVYCLGPFQVYHEDHMVTEWNGGKGLCIFKYLVANIRKPVPKDILMDVFWPEADPEAARRNLHQGVYCLRESFRRLSPEIQHVRYRNDCYSISPEADIWIDADDFEKHVQRGHRLGTSGNIREAMAEYAIAEELFQGDFMEEELYADWPAMRRHHLRDLYFEIADLLAGFHIREKNYLSAGAVGHPAVSHLRAGIEKRVGCASLS